MDDYIRLVKEVETHCPDWTGEQVLNNMRVLALADDLGGKHGFQRMYGLDNLDDPSWAQKYGHDKRVSSEHGANPELVRQLLIDKGIPSKDLDELVRMSAHANKDASGYAFDQSGEKVALGHVLTGIASSAELYGNKEVDIAGLPISGSPIAPTVDNLFATTISGDLGSSAALVDAGEQRNLIGKDTEAEGSELNGDVDGFLVGKHLDELTDGRKLSKTGNDGGISLSEVLEKYYHGKDNGHPNEMNAGNRYNNIKADLIDNQDGQKNLIDQTERFEANYKYKVASDSKEKGDWLTAAQALIWPYLPPDTADLTVAAFDKWVLSKTTR